METDIAIADAQAFLRDNHHAVLATRRRDGRPQLSPVVATVDDEGRVTVSSTETRYKVKNLQRDPRASLVAFVDEFFGQWVQVDGTAEIVHLPEAMALLVETYRRIAGEHEDWDEFRQAMRDEGRVIIRITIERAGPKDVG